MQPHLIALALTASSLAAQTPQYQTIPKSSQMYASSNFGQVIALDGDLLATSDPSAALPSENRPVITFFERSNSGWTLSYELQNPVWALVTGDYGASIALDGTTLAVSSYRYNTFGALYLYEHDAQGAWNQTQLLSCPFQGPTVNTPRSGFGRALHIGNGELVVGAAAIEAVGIQNVGRVYCYRHGPGGWQLQQTLEPDPADRTHNLGFGSNVVRHSDTLMVSATRWPAHLLGPGIFDGFRGSVYHFERLPGGTWALVEILINANGDLFDRFGEAVALTDDLLAVGKPQDPSWATDISEVMLYERGANRTWSYLTSLRASDASGGASFGASVAIEGDTIVVGAPRAPGSSVNPSNEGALYVYRRDALGNWPTLESERLVVEQGNTAGLGVAVAFEDGSLVGGSTGGFPAQAALFMYAQGAERDICVPTFGSANVAARVDLHGDAVAGSGRQNVLLSRCAPSSRYLVLASLMGNGGGCGPVLGGMPLCLCGALHRAAFGQLGPADTLAFVDLPALHPLAQRLFSQIGSVYLQAYVAEPGGTQHAGLTNAVRLDLY